MTEPTKTYKRKVKFLDLDTFEINEKVVNFSFAAPSTYEEAVERVEPTVSRDGEVRSSREKRILSAINGILLSDTAKNAMSEAGVSDNLKIVNKILRPFRGMAPWKTMSKEKQDEALFAMLKSNEALVQTIRENAENDDDDPESDDDGE
jgi:hypothetical protein